MKKLICSTHYNRMNDLIVFAYTLRNMGKYKDKILILNYNKKNEEYNKIGKEFNLEFVYLDLVENRHVSFLILRYFDLLKVLYDHKFFNYAIAHFDLDIWFQDDVNDLFPLCENINGCVFSHYYDADMKSRIKQPCDHFLYATAETKIKFIKNIDLINKLTKVNNSINGGLIAGTYINILNKLSQVFNIIKSLRVLRLGMDETAFNLLFDKDRDSLGGFLWNCCNSSEGRFVKNGIYYCNKRGKDEKIIGFHLTRNIKTENK